MWHHEIKAFEGGKEIEVKTGYNTWVVTKNPEWNFDEEYRIKQDIVDIIG